MEKFDYSNHRGVLAKAINAFEISYDLEIPWTISARLRENLTDTEFNEAYNDFIKNLGTYDHIVFQSFLNGYLNYDRKKFCYKLDMLIGDKTEEIKQCLWAYDRGIDSSINDIDFQAFCDYRLRFNETGNSLFRGYKIHSPEKGTFESGSLSEMAIRLPQEHLGFLEAKVKTYLIKSSIHPPHGDYFMMLVSSLVGMQSGLILLNNYMDYHSLGKGDIFDALIFGVSAFLGVDSFKRLSNNYFDPKIADKIIKKRKKNLERIVL